jgi:hypothetical protein
VKKGDFVGFIFGGPGPDVTYLVVTEVEDNMVTAYDPFFDVTITYPSDQFWLATEKELGIKGSSYIDGIYKSYIVKDVLEIAKKRKEMKYVKGGLK